MDVNERIRLLRSLELFAALPEARLTKLAELLEPLTVEDGGAVIMEGQPSDGMYYITSGSVRVTKRLGEGGEKDLAFLGAGESLGEMELVHDTVRSASAYAQGRVQLLRLKSANMRAWLESDQEMAARFFASLSAVQAARLRRTSDEVALLYDLSQLLVTPQATAKGLLAHALSRVTPHLQGRWSAEARLYDQFEDEMVLAARLGSALGPDAPEPAPKTPSEAAWSGGQTLQLFLRAPKRALGLLRFRAEEALDEAKRVEAGRTLGAVARLLTSALENVEFRNDEALRERLREKSHGTSF